MDVRNRRSSGVSCFRSTKIYPYGVDVASAKRLLNKLDSTGIHLFGQCSHLRHISRILEHHYVCEFKLMVRLSLFFWKQVLHEIYDGSITVVALFREQVRHALVGFGHEIV